MVLNDYLHPLIHPIWAVPTEHLSFTTVRDPGGHLD